MNLKKLMVRFIPSFIIIRIRRLLRLNADRKRLATIQRLDCKVDNLRPCSDISFSEIFRSRLIESMWLDSEKEINQFKIPDGTGGANLGDRKAIYFLISAFKPTSVLEIGTHIGTSTVHIASALHKNKVGSDIDANLTSVDIIDVNSPINKPWLEYGTTYSPAEMIDKMGHGTFVNFAVDTSVNYLANCERKYDFIFLDGNHSAVNVYQEIPVALNLLNKNGVILLHDYFPDLKPLWPNGSMIPGPFLATDRFRKEGLNVTVLPLGKLPWRTKLNSHYTSLALLLKNG